MKACLLLRAQRLLCLKFGAKPNSEGPHENSYQALLAAAFLESRGACVQIITIVVTFSIIIVYIAIIFSRNVFVVLKRVILMPVNIRGARCNAGYWVSREGLAVIALTDWRMFTSKVVPRNRHVDHILRLLS